MDQNVGDAGLHAQTGGGFHLKDEWAIVGLLALGVVAWLFFGRGSGAQVIGAANPGDIIAANTAENTNATNEHIAAANDATSYATAKVNADSAVRQAVAAGNSAVDIQKVVTAGQVAINAAQVKEALAATRVVTRGGVLADKISATAQTKQNWQTTQAARLIAAIEGQTAQSVASTEANAQVAINQQNTAAQSSNGFWNFLTSIGSIVTRAFIPNFGASAASPTQTQPSVVSYTPVPAQPGAGVPS